MGVWGASLPRQLCYFQIARLCVDEEEFLSRLVWCAKHCNYFSLTEQSFCPKLPFCLRAENVISDSSR